MADFLKTLKLKLCTLLVGKVHIESQHLILQPLKRKNNYLEGCIYSLQYPENKDTFYCLAYECVHISHLVEADKNSTGKSSPYYILSYKDTEHLRIKEYHEVAECNEELISYLKNGKQKEGEIGSKECRTAIASIMLNIKQIAKTNVIVGSTDDFDLVNKYMSFTYTEDMPNEEFMYAYSKVYSSQDKKNIMRMLTGKNYYIIQDVIDDFTGSRICKEGFSCCAWKIYKHQINYGSPILPEVLRYVSHCSIKEDVIKDGDNISGLDFGKQEQFDVIKLARSLDSYYYEINGQYKCPKYIDELQDENGWLSIEDMTKKSENYPQLLAIYQEKSFELMRPEPMSPEEAIDDWQNELNILLAKRATTFDYEAQQRLDYKIDDLRVKIRNLKARLLN